MASVRLFAETDVMKRINNDARTQIQILMDSSQTKQLSVFYKILVTVWFNEDNEQVFTDNI